MEDRKLFELSIEWKDVYNSPPSATVRIDLNEDFATLAVQKKAQLSFAELSLQSSLSITLYSVSRAIASSTHTLNALFGGKLQGKVDKWFRLKTEDDRLVKIRVSMQLLRTETRKRSASTSVPRAPKKDVRCPYLENLAFGREENLEAINNLWKTRDTQTVEGGTLRISLEPDSPAKSRADEDFSPSDVSIQTLSQLTGSQVKKVVKYLCEEAKHLGAFAEQLPAMRAKLKDTIKERRTMQDMTEEQTEEMKSGAHKKEEHFQELLSTRKRLAIQVNAERERLRKEELEADILHGQLGDLQRESVLLKIHELRESDSTDLLSQCRKAAKETDQKRSQLEISTKESIQEMRKIQQKTEEEHKRILSDLEKLKDSLNATSTVYQEAREKNMKLEKEYAQLKQQIVPEDLSDRLKAISKKVEVSAKTQKEQFEHLSKLSGAVITSDAEAQFSGKQAQMESLAQTEAIDLELSNALNILKKQLLDCSSQQVTIEQSCCIQGDLIQLIEEFQEIKEKKTDLRQSALSDLQIASEFAFVEGQKIHQKASQLETMIDTVDNLDHDIENSKDVMAEVRKRRPPYVPVENDYIDAAVADCINRRRDPLIVNFVRDGPGRYTFGSRKVHIKSENGKLLLFKAGTSYVSFDDYIELYHQKELDKARANLPGLVSKIAPGATTKKTASSAASALLSLGRKSPKK